MGPTGGGVWKTVDAGQSWLTITDGQIGAGSMGAIDVVALRSEHRSTSAPARTACARTSPSATASTSRPTPARRGRTSGSATSGNIGGVRVHPSNPNIAFVAAIGNPFKPNAERGVYRTKDGGRTWQKVLFVSDSTGAVDVEFQPGNPNVVFAVNVARRAKAVDDHLRRARGRRLPQHGRRRRRGRRSPTACLTSSSARATSPSRNANPNRIYVLMEAKPGNGLYRSDDGGLTFQVASTFPQIITRPFYYTTITADPKNADVMYAGAEGYFQSTDAGKTWQPLRMPHGDNHDMWINPNNSDIMIQANDGGANVSLNGGRTWSTQYNQPTAEIYQVYVDNQFPYRLYGAQQDNSTLIVPSLPTVRRASGRPDAGVDIGTRLRDRSRSCRTRRIPTPSTARARGSTRA